MDPEERLVRLRRHSRWLSRLTMVLLIATALVIVLPALMVFVSRGGMVPPRMMRFLVMALPSIPYLYAIWAISRAFAGFARGGIFGRSMASGCVRAGVALALGATLSAVGVPNLLWVMADAGLIDQSSPRFGSVLVFDTAYLAVGVVGLALMLLGRLLARAAELQSESAALRSELSEFF